MISSSSVTPTNWTEEWTLFLDGDETPLICKIVAVALPLILVASVCLMMECSPLASLVTVITTGMLLDIFYEKGELSLMRKKLDAEITTLLGILHTVRQCQTTIFRYERESTLDREAFRSFTDIVRAIGGYHRWPVLDLNGRTGRNSSIDFLLSEDLSHSVMTGLYQGDRPFY